jgi:hypothetical protein
MALTTIQVISLARAKLLEQTTEIISDETILIYANLAYQDLIKRIFTNDKILSSTISFTSGVGTLPTLFGTLYGSAQSSGGETFEEVSIEDFDNKTLSRMVTIEGGTIKCYPTDTANLSIKYYPTFAALTSGSNPAINEYFHECIVYGILERAFEDLQDESLSAYYKTKYEGEVTKRSGIQSNYEEGNQRGGEMFAYQQLI